MANLTFVETTCPTCDGFGQLTTPNPQSLRDVREAAGISVRKFARSLGLSASYISDIELGKRGCTAAIESAYQLLADKPNQKRKHGKKSGPARS